MARTARKQKPKARESVERLFLKYAFPCTFVIRQRGQVDDETFAKLERAALEGRKVGRTVLERVYKKAFARLRKVAKGLKEKGYWSERVVREYFLRRHNGMIAGDEDYRNAPKVLRELCKVVTAKVLEKGEGFLVVAYGKGKIRTVGSVFVPEAKIGDKVTIHYGYAVEVMV